MKFQLPQFIETETKLVGPFTLKQFLWIAGGCSLSFLVFITIGGTFAIFLIVPIALISLAFAFLKINDVPLVNYLAYFLSYSFNPKKYTYQKKQDENIIPGRPQ